MRKKTIFTWIVAISALLLTTQPASAEPFVSLDVLNDNIVVGNSFDVEVWVSSDGTCGDLTGFGFDFFWPEDLFFYAGVILGDGFDDVSLVLPNNISGLWYPSVSQDQALLLATLSFEALKVGTGSLSIDGDFDGQFYGLFYQLDDFDIYASKLITVNPVPEPSSLMLLAVGIGGLGLVRGGKAYCKAEKRVCIAVV